MSFPIILFLVLLAFALTPWASPPAALVLGVAYALVFSQPSPDKTRRATKVLLQASIVGLGFGMNLRQVLHAGADGFVYTAFSIAFALVMGWLLGRALKVQKTTAYLVSVGTAICGGSAIAAVAPVIGAGQEEISIALGTVFLLNSAALLIFPFIGHALGLGQTQFGLWAALAIHDTSSVVGATVKYGAGALAGGTPVKLARALWIVPICLGTAAHKRSGAKIHYPWFILFFALAVAVNTALPALSPAWGAMSAAAKAGLTLTLFLIGTGISRATLAKVGPRPVAQGVSLWVIVGAVSLALIRTGVIR